MDIKKVTNYPEVILPDTIYLRLSAQGLEIAVSDNTGTTRHAVLIGTVSQAQLDDISTDADTRIAAAVATLEGGVATEGDNLNKLYGLIVQLQGILTSDNANLDTLQEVIAFIEANRDDLDALGLTKVNITDIVDNLTSVDVNKPLSANQGKILKGLLDRQVSPVVAVAALDIDCSLGNYFTKTIDGASVITISNVPAGVGYGLTLEITHTSGAITFPATVKWPGDTVPTLTVGKTHLFTFITDDGGARWRGIANTNYVN